MRVFAAGSRYIDTAVLEDARNTVIALTPNPDGPRNLSGLIENAVRREIRRLQDEFNDGHAFPARRVQLQPGRPGGY